MSRPWRRRLLLPPVVLIIFASVSPIWAIRNLTHVSPDQQTHPLPLQTQGTAPPTATSVASGTPTVTLTPSPTSAPALTPVPLPGPLPQDLGLSLAAAPVEARPGGVVTYTLGLANAGAVRATGLVISDTLPAGLLYVPRSAGDGQYDPVTRRLTWSVAGLDAGAAITRTFQARVAPSAPDPLLNHAEVAGANLRSRPTATAWVHVRHTAEQVVQPDTPARLALPGGRITLEVPAGAVPGPARFTYRSRAARPLDTGRPGLALQFELTARSVAAGAPIMRFQKPLRLTVDLTELVDVDALQPGESLFVGYQDPTTGRWMPLPVIDRRPGPALTVEVDHFTLLGAGTDHEYESGWVLPFHEAHVSLFDGGFTYSYPIQVPPGRGGLQPDLNLSYHSRRVDGILSWIQTDWAGLGWSVDTVDIVREVNINSNWKNDKPSYHNEFTLLFNGVGYKLEPADPDQCYGRYHTADEQFLYIERRNAPWCANQGGCTAEEQADNQTSEYWIVKTQDGTEYRLGYHAESEQVAKGIAYRWDGAGPPQNRDYAGGVEYWVVFRWRLDRVVDTRGNRMVLDYAEESDPNAEPPRDRDRASYLREVCYNQIVVNGEKRCGNRVRFERLPRGSGSDPVDDYRADDTNRFYFYQRDYLDRIQVQFWNTATITYETQSEYVLSYVPGIDRPDLLETRLLDRVIRKGRGGQDLPATTFDYQVYPNKGICHAFWGGECTDGLHDEWDQEPFRYERLSQVDNGYGGVITTTYQTPDGSIDEGYWQTKNYRVAHRATLDRGAVISQVDYTHPPNEDLDQRCYDNDDDQVCDDPASFAGGHTGGELVGYKTVTETLKTGAGTPVAVTEHAFWLRDRSSPTFALGREIEARYKDANGTTLRTVQRTYSDDSAGRVHFIRLDQVDTYAGDLTALHTRTEYSYDAYGNLTRTIEHGNVNAAGDERTTHYLYYPRDDGQTYIVDRVARETLYAGIHPQDDHTGVVARTRYRYDDGTCLGEPVAGRLTAVDRWNGGSGDPGDCYAAAFDTTAYAYDPYGNPISVTDPLSRTTMTEYDDLFHTYPITHTNALGQTTITQYYGVNGAPATGEGAFFGQVESVTDPNDATTRYTYDALGRRTAVIRPGDTITTPTTAYAYRDDLEPQAPVMRATWRKREAGAGPWSTGGTWERRFYDGLGPLIQVQTPYQDWAGGHTGEHDVVRFTTYDAQGLKASESVPYLAPAYVPDTCNGRTCNPYQAPDLSQPRTTYAYDGLGRIESETAPDGRRTEHRYGVADGLAYHDVLDPNRHRTQYRYDAYGRLGRVYEIAGDCGYWGYPCEAPYTTYWSIYATTHYAYDVQDRLRVVTDTTGITTTIDYDPLGRKTAMADPDMGQWAYAYDDAGNLTRQTDARDQTICFYYDDVNRLTGKHYRSDTNCPTSNPGSNVRYTYDDGSNGVGRRTSMTDSSGHTSWGYDARGRVVTETQTIGALGTYTTTYSYDSQDQVVGMTYPDGEVITTTYNVMGLPRTLADSLGATYVADASYTPEGRLDVLDLGNGLQVNRDYYAWETPNGQGRLQRLQAGPSAAPTSLQNLSYTYDAVGNVATLTDAGETTNFSYDALDRLETASGIYSAGYSYDAIGNLLSKDEAGVGHTLAYTDTQHVHAPSVVDGAVYTYDENGNLTGRNGDTLVYDAENRLQSVTSGGETIIFTYDGDGRRVLRDTATETIAYVGPHYEARFNKQPMAEDLDNDCQVTVIDIMRVAARWGQAGGPEDLDGSGTVDVGDIQRVAGRWRETCHVLAETVKYYALGGQRVAMRKAGTLYYLFTDHLGSTSVSYNTATSQTQTLRYYPWGGVRAGDAPTDRRFTGQRWDGTIDLYDYQARFYDPVLGRFVQPDTIVPDPGNPQDLNRYSYVRNNPLTYTDPSGHAVPVRFRQLEIKLPSWAQSRPIRWALTVACLPISCHVEQGVLRGPTPEEQITTAIQPMPMSVAGSAAGNLADDVADDIMRAGAQKFEQEVLPGFKGLLFRAEEAIRSEIMPAWKLLARRVPDTDVHHLIEKRFARKFGVKPNDLPAIRLDRTFHQQEVTARLFRGDNLPTYPPRAFSSQEIWTAYVRVYGKELGRQDWLEAIWPYFERLGVVR